MSWPTVSLGSIVELERDGAEPSALPPDTRYVGLEHIDSDGAVNSEATVGTAELKSTKFRFDKKHILYGKLRPYLRKIACPDFGGVCSTDIIPIRLTAAIDRGYLFYFLRSSEMVALATSRCTGANLPRLNPSQLEAFEVPLPPLHTQKRIAAILDAADALRAKRRESIEQLDSLVQATFLEMFGDPATNPKRWAKCPLDAACSHIIDCPHSTPSWSTDGVICLRTSNLGKGCWDWSDQRFVSEAEYMSRSRRLELQPGDVVLSREGTVGIAAIITPNMRACMGQRLVQVRANLRRIVPHYLLRVLLHALSPDRISQAMAGSTSKHLNVRDLRGLEISIPSLDLQTRFASIVESIEQQKARLKAHLAELDTLFASLQSRAFNGELVA